jgi:hypothetical protein
MRVAQFESDSFGGNFRPAGLHQNGRPKFEGAPGLTDIVMSYMQIMNEKRAEADEKLAIAAFTEKWTLPAAPEIADPLDLLWVAES